MKAVKTIIWVFMKWFYILLLMLGHLMSFLLMMRLEFPIKTIFQNVIWKTHDVSITIETSGNVHLTCQTLEIFI